MNHHNGRRRPSFVDEDDESRQLISAISTNNSEVETMSLDHMHVFRGNPRLRAYFIRALALLCVCSLSIGSH
jgi:hypothetical protein